MSANSSIQWCHHTFNAWWGCEKVSPGCKNCYAAAFDKRVGGKHWGPKAERRFFGDAHWAEPLKWNRKAEKLGERHRVFCASMADVFEDRPELVEPRRNLFDLIKRTQSLDWLLLTKRPENITRLWPAWPGPGVAAWPTVWLGTTVEDQQRANERIPHLLAVPAAVRFLSCEPLLERVDLSGPWRLGAGGNFGLDWVIIGGESGPGARPFHLEWARDLVQQFRASGVALFMKQLGVRTRMTGEEYARYCITPLACEHGFDVCPECDSGTRVAKYGHGEIGRLDIIPPDLRVREFPAVKGATP